MDSVGGEHPLLATIRARYRPRIADGLVQDALRVAPRGKLSNQTPAASWRAAATV